MKFANEGAKDKTRENEREVRDREGWKRKRGEK